jgi:hypothetical protein
MYECPTDSTQVCASTGRRFQPLCVHLTAHDIWKARICYVGGKCEKYWVIYCCLLNMHGTQAEN